MNHFIELGVDSKNNKYLTIHSGSRNLGKQVAETHQEIAINLCNPKDDYSAKKEEIIAYCKANKLEKEIEDRIKELKREFNNSKGKYPKDLCFLTGKERENYLNDMKICQEYATLNREVMANIIISNLLSKKLSDFEYFETIHNYINFNDNIIRKGAISAHKGEKVLIPINMRDGSLIAIGKGNTDWNYSAPHGAGRLMSRSQAKETFLLEDFKETMKGIYSTSIHEGTLDESPFAYKPIEEILENITDTVDLVEQIKPIYNFKS